jgi:hypothetical protein
MTYGRHNIVICIRLQSHSIFFLLTYTGFAKELFELFELPLSLGIPLVDLNRKLDMGKEFASISHSAAICSSQ